MPPAPHKPPAPSRFAHWFFLFLWLLVELLAPGAGECGSGCGSTAETPLSITYPDLASWRWVFQDSLGPCSDCSGSSLFLSPAASLCHLPPTASLELPLGIHLARKTPSNHVCLGSWKADPEPSTGLASGWIPWRWWWQDVSLSGMSSTPWAIPLLGWTVPHSLVTSRSSWSWIFMF